jgi:Bacterial regulatory helix-turn-helix protein, lysR family/TonB dependent receptor
VKSVLARCNTEPPTNLSAAPCEIRILNCAQNQLDIRQLQYLVALAREKHFTRAAQACHVTQNNTTQTQNVGNGSFSGFELSVDAPVGSSVRAGGNYTFTHCEITDALQPNLRPTGVPTNRAFVYATWRPLMQLRITPSLDLADDRWSDVNPAPAFP